MAVRVMPEITFRHPHRSVRAPLTHTVPRITDSLCTLSHTRFNIAICCLLVDTCVDFIASLCVSNNSPVIRHPPFLLTGSFRLSSPVFKQYYGGAKTSCQSSQTSSFPSQSGTVLSFHLFAHLQAESSLTSARRILCLSMVSPTTIFYLIRN